MLSLSELVGQANILYTNQSKFTKEDWHSTKHTHYFTEIMYILQGEGYLLTETDRQPLRKGDMLVINPYVLHTESSTEKNPLWYLVVGVDNITFQRENKGKYYIFRDNTENIENLVKVILFELIDRQTGSDEILRRLVEVLMMKIIRSNGFNAEMITSKNVSKDSALIKEYIDEHYKEDLNLDLISYYLHFDKYYMIHIFKENFNDTPMNYLNQRRLKSAKNLLATTDFSIGQIAEITGFTSQSYFNQSFKKNEKISPNQYRKAAKS